MHTSIYDLDIFFPSDVRLGRNITLEGLPGSKTELESCIVFEEGPVSIGVKPSETTAFNHPKGGDFY